MPAPTPCRFEGKAVIVTGAAHGLGRAIAARFSAEGARVLLADIDEAGVTVAAAALNGSVALQTDVSVQADNEAMVARAVEQFGRLDVLINNAAFGTLGRITELDPETWRRVFAVGVDSIFYASRAAMPHLAKSNGAIVNTGSISGLAGDYGLAAYNSMKGAVANLTRSMALDHAADGVRVNALAPGAIRADGPHALDPHPVLGPQFRTAIPMGRMAEPEEVAAAAAFLASDDASYITGINLVIDGGLTAATGQPNVLRGLTAPAE